MTPAELARRLFRDQCGIGPNSSLEAYGETAAVAAMVPLIEALEGILPGRLCGESWNLPGNETVQISTTFGKLRRARAALTPQPDRQTVVNGHIIKEYYWAGDMVVYVNGRLSGMTWDMACEHCRDQPAKQEIKA